MYLVIEKIDGPWAIIEWGKESFTVPKFLLPGSAQAGDKVKIQISLYNESIRLRRQKPVTSVFDDLDDL